MSDDQLPCVDPAVLQALRRELGPDGDAVVHEVLQAFPGDSRVQTDRFIASAPAGELAKAAHRLRGTALNLGAVRLSAICARAEALGMSGDQAGALALRDTILREVACVVDQLPSLGRPAAGP